MSRPAFRQDKVNEYLSFIVEISKNANLLRNTNLTSQLPKDRYNRSNPLNTKEKSPFDSGPLPSLPNVPH